MNRLWAGVLLAAVCATPLCAQMGEDDEPEMDWELAAGEYLKCGDANKDGKLTVDELCAAWNDYYKELRAAGEDEDKASAVYEKYNYLMNGQMFGLADANADRTLTKAELADCFKRAKAADDNGESLTPTGKQCDLIAEINFAESGYDADGDGVLSGDELDIATDADELKRFDPNGDGKVTRAEYAKAFGENLRKQHNITETPDKPTTDKPTTDKPATDKPTTDKPDEGDFEIKKDMFTWYTKVGRTWTVKMVATTGGMETVMYYKYEITKVTDEEAEYTTVMLDKDMKEIPGMPSSTVKMSFKVPKVKTSAAPTTTAAKTGEEKITVKAGEFECTTVEFESNGMKSKSWTSKKFPGLMVKNETSGAASSTMELVEYKE